MTPHLITAGIALLAIAATGLIAWHGRNHREYGDWPIGDVLGAFLTVCVAVTFFIIFVVCLWVPHYTENACARWGDEVGRETQFVRVTYWEWHCNVLTDEGWIDRDNTIKVDD